jgi:hypothetical protein
MAKTTPSPQAQVLEYFQRLDHPLADVVQALRNILLDTDPALTEHIKWNSPAFYYTGPMQPFAPKEYKRDLVVFNLHKKDRVLLVFPTGARINDASELLQGTFPDGRRTAEFASVQQVAGREQDLRAVVKQWLAGVV